MARLLLTFVRLPTLINSSHPLTHGAEVTEAESFAILSAVETLTGEESQSKEEIISGLSSGEGELQGVACKEIALPIEAATLTKDVTPDSRLIEIQVSHNFSPQDFSSQNYPS